MARRGGADACDETGEEGRGAGAAERRRAISMA